MYRVSVSHLRVVALLMFAQSLCLASPQPQPQKGGNTSSFVIDPNRPYVYIEFDHIGKGIQRWETEPTLRIWFRLMNNCRLPIAVRTYGVPEGSPEDEQGVMDIIVANEPPQGMRYGLTRDGTVQPKPFGKARPDELPHGYSFGVRGFQSIPPGKAVLFSVPINHVGPRWYFEVPFQFDVPKGHPPRDPRVGGFPRMVPQYNMHDLPPEGRKEVEHWYGYDGAKSPGAPLKSR
jgi:hypothetical protein